MQEIVLAVWQRILKTVGISMIILSAFFIANDLVMSIAILAIGAWMLFLSLMAFEEDCKVIPLVKEQEYMDYLILNRKQITKQNTQLLDEIELLQKRLKIAISALQYYAEGTLGSSVAEQALKDMEKI